MAQGNEEYPPVLPTSIDCNHLAIVLTHNAPPCSTCHMTSTLVYLQYPFPKRYSHWHHQPNGCTIMSIPPMALLPLGSRDSKHLFPTDRAGTLDCWSIVHPDLLWVLHLPNLLTVEAIGRFHDGLLTPFVHYRQGLPVRNSRSS